MPLVIQPSWKGRRISVRRVLEPDADAASGGGLRFGDVVGDLLALDATSARIQTRHGEVEVPRDRIALARLAPPSTADELALADGAAAGWRAPHIASIAGWLLRAAGGFTNRANSVLPLRAPGRPLDEALAAAAAWYARRDLPLRLQIPTDARRLLDADLAERGWPASPDVHVLAARLDMLADAPAGAPTVELDAEPDAGWLARYRGGSAQSATARALLRRHDRVAFAQVRQDAATIAIGRGAVDGEWLGITAVEVDPARRREGLASAIVAALRSWGAAQGARRSYLQVPSDNTGALALYERLGYWRHHNYRYRTAPE
jgi:ribosomal protein S18 acetylase RimI-like enzyme